MPVLKNTLFRSEKRLLQKIKSSSSYKWIAWSIFLLFWFKKKYFVFWRGTTKKNLWIVSITSDKILWKKLSYIDDFVVHKRARGKWIWNRLFSNAMTKAENEEKSDYVFLVTKWDRKASHNIYKKFWFTMISLGIWILAYKKLKNNKK